MLLLVVLCLLAALAHVSSSRHEAEYPKPHPSFKHCAYKREAAIECAQRYADREENADGTRGNGLICVAEVDQLENAILTPLQWLLSFLYSTSKVIARCDHDGDGQISLDDFLRSSETCLKDCTAVTQFFDVVCKKAADMKLDLPEVACE